MVVTCHDRRGQVVGQALGHAHGARPRPSPAVRRGERLVGVDVHDVEAHVARPAPAEDRVEVGAVVVDERADVVDHAGDLLDPFLEQAERVRVREHQAGDLIVEQAGERLHVDEPALVGGHAHRLEPGEADAGRVRAVRGVGDQHLGARRRRDPGGRRA